MYFYKAMAKHNWWILQKLMITYNILKRKNLLILVTKLSYFLVCPYIIQNKNKDLYRTEETFIQSRTFPSNWILETIYPLLMQWVPNFQFKVITYLKISSKQNIQSTLETEFRFLIQALFRLKISMNIKVRF